MISDEEISFFRRKNLSVPKRCQACRDLNKQQKSKRILTVHQKEGMQIPKAKKKQSQWFITCLLIVLGIGGLSFWGLLSDEEDRQFPQQLANERNQQGQVLSFRTEDYASEHFEKHRDEFDYQTVEQYIAAANQVISSPHALHKIEQEDGDDVYYLAATNELVIVSTDGYIRTYFKPEDGIDYYQRK